MIFFSVFCRHVYKSDESLYECQISTEPKMSFYTSLNVIGKVINSLNQFVVIDVVVNGAVKNKY